MSKSPWYNSDGRVGVGQISTYIPYRGAVSKYDQWWVVAFRNRRIEE